MNKGYGIPVEQMSSAELGYYNRARISAKTNPVTVGFKCRIMCQNLPATETNFVCAFAEGLETPVVAFLAELGAKACAEWGSGRLDAINGKFVWQPLAMAKTPEQQAGGG